MHRWEIDGRFDITTNAGVLEFLRRTMPSAHSDVAEELRRSASGLDRVFNYCPDPRRYAFVLHHLADFSIIGVAYGNRGSLTGCRTSGGGRRSKTGVRRPRNWGLTGSISLRGRTRSRCANRGGASPYGVQWRRALRRAQMRRRGL